MTQKNFHFYKLATQTANLILTEDLQILWRGVDSSLHRKRDYGILSKNKETSMSEANIALIGNVPLASQRIQYPAAEMIN